MRLPPTTCQTAWSKLRFFVRDRIGLPRAIALISEQPARMAGLKDRGRIAPEQRADLVRVRLHDTLAGGAPGVAGR